MLFISIWKTILVGETYPKFATKIEHTEKWALETWSQRRKNEEIIRRRQGQPQIVENRERDSVRIRLSSRNNVHAGRLEPLFCFFIKSNFVHLEC